MSRLHHSSASQDVAQTGASISNGNSRLVLLAFGMACLALLGLGVQYFMLPSSGRVGIVRTKEILEKYPGAIDARAAFTGTANALRQNLDTLQQELQHMLIELQQGRATMAATEVAAREQAIRLKDAQVRDYAKAVDQKTAEEQKSLTESLINHVKSAAETVAEQQGVDVVFTVGDDGQIVFHASGVDLTDEVLATMRKSYRGELRSTKQ